MATLYITEFTGQGFDGNNNLSRYVAMPPVAEQTVAIGGASAASAAVNVRTGLLRICPDAICSIAISANPTATATSMRLAAGQEFYCTVPIGAAMKVAVITNT